MRDDLPSEAAAGDLQAATDVPTEPAPRRIAERRVVGGATVARLLGRRAFRPAGNSVRFWSRIEEDDPFVPSPPRPATGPLAPLPAVGSPTTEPARSSGDPVRPADEPPRPRAPRAPEPKSGARPRSPDEIPRPRTPETAPSRPASESAPEVDRRPPIVPVKSAGASSSRGRVRMPAASEPAPPRASPAPAKPAPRANSIDDYVAYIGKIEALERERAAEEATAGPVVPQRRTGGLDDLLGDPGESRVRLPRPNRRRDEG